MVILIVLKWQNSGCACVYFNNYVACIALHHLPAVRPCSSSNIYTVKWLYFLMGIPENTWEKRAPIMLCSNAPLLIMFLRVVCYAHDIIHELCRKYKVDPLSDACTPYNVKLKFFIMLYHFVITIAMFSYAANVESYAHNSPCKAFLVSTTL